MTTAQIRRFWLLMGGALLMIIAAPVLFWMHGVNIVTQWDWDDSLQGALMLVVWAVIPVVLQMERTARLTITESGLSYECELPHWLYWLSPMVTWSARWGEIKRVHLFRQAGVVALVIQGRQLTERLQLLGWVPALQAQGYAPFEAQDSKDVEKSPVWRALVANSVTARTLAGATFVDFDLMKHSGSRTALVACAMLGGAGLIAIVAESETYIADGYEFLTPHGAAGIVGLLLFWYFLARTRLPAKLPAGVPIGIALVGGMASATFSYGGLVLANRVVADAVPVAYSVGSPCTTLVPSDSKLPRIIWSGGYSDYWCQFKQGKELTIAVRTGLFGTYQFDQGAYVEQIRAYRRAKELK